MRQFDVCFANVRIEESGQAVYYHRPTIVIKEIQDWVIALKCTSNLNTPAPHYSIQMLPEAGLDRNTAIVLKNYIKIPKEQFDEKPCGRLAIYDITSLQVKLDERKFKMGMQEKLILDEALFEDYTELTEAKKRKKKKISQTNPGEAIFKSVNDMKKWVKKRQKGLSPFSYLNTNAGNVPLSNSIFNSMFSSDGSSGVGTSEGGVSNGGLSSSDAGGGMGESLQLIEVNKHKSKNANQNAIKDLKWYETPAGNLPAKDFYDNCNQYIKKLFDNLFKLLKNNQLAQIKDCSKLLDSKEHIFELRLKDGDFWYRLTYFRADDGNILLTGFTKKRNETDDIEIQKAIKCKKNYLLYRRGQNIDVK